MAGAPKDRAARDEEIVQLSTRPFRSPRRCARMVTRTEALQEHKSAHADASGLRTSPIMLMIEPKIGVSRLRVGEGPFLPSIRAGQSRR